MIQELGDILKQKPEQMHVQEEIEDPVIAEGQRKRSDENYARIYQMKKELSTKSLEEQKKYIDDLWKKDASLLEAITFNRIELLALGETVDRVHFNFFKG